MPDPEKVKYIEAHIKKHRIYESYHDMCMRLDIAPVTRDDLVAKYVDIIERHEEFFEQAKSELENDKRQLLEGLEKEGAPVEDLASVESLPPSVYIPINEMKGSMVCLYVLFPGEAYQPYIVPAYVADGDDTAIFM